MDPKRKANIADWWEGGFSGGCFCVKPLEHRLRHAFERVLEQLPAEAFAAFLAVEPTVVCPAGASANLFILRAVVPPSEQPQEALVTVMYFDPTAATRKSDAALLNTVAHEVAHVVLGHHRTGLNPFHRNSDDEEAADRLLESWGFKRRYTKGQLQKMRDQERRLKGAE